MKKVLAIAPYPYLPYFSGGQKFIAKFFEYLGKELPLTVISNYENDSSLAKTYTFHPMFRKRFTRYLDFSLISRISQVVKEQGIDTIIWEHPYYAWLAQRVRKRTGARTFIHTHNIEYQRFRSTSKWWWPILEQYEKWSFKMADGLLFITPEDKAFAVTKWGIAKEKCFDLPYGVEIRNYPGDRHEANASIKERHGISSNDKIIFFNGLLDYKPNLDALKVILNEINPHLLELAAFPYKIIICGNRLPAQMNDLKEYAYRNIIYAGYTNEIDLYYKASDIFLNPVQTGGGIKTKMVESIAYGTTVISTMSGAAGMDRTVCGNKLVVIDDNNWKAYSRAIIEHMNDQSQTPQSYYDYYGWENIVKMVTTDLAH
jgi:glycosyltransferase involved in cell wall biosynthesis